MSKKYYWLKLQKDFFKDPRIKKLRRIAGGDTYACIYLELMLLSLETDGILIYEGIEPTFEAELSLIIDEDETNIRVVLDFLMAQGLLERFENKFSLSQVINLIGSETDSAERVRKLRAKQNEAKALQCNNSVTSGNKNVTLEKEIEKELSTHTHAHTREENQTLNDQEKINTLKAEQPVMNNLPSFIDPNVWDFYLAYVREKGWRFSVIELDAKFAEWAKWASEGIDVNERLHEAIFAGYKNPTKPKPPKKTIEGEDGIFRPVDDDGYEIRSAVCE